VFRLIDQFKELCQNRHSIRSFTEEPVADELIKKILEVIQTAPSAGNLQAYEVVVVKDPQERQKLAKAAFGQGCVTGAPVVLAFVALPVTSGQRYGSRGAQLYSIQDATIACTYATLAATALGLSSVWVGAFQEEEVRPVLKADASHIPVALLPIGYGAEEPLLTPRRSLEDIARSI